jgi:hypothetical protein
VVTEYGMVDLYGKSIRQRASCSSRSPTPTFRDELKHQAAELHYLYYGEKDAYDRQAKIVATIGPSSHDRATLESMIQAGMDVARLNFSHGTHAEHKQRIEMLRTLSAEFTGQSHLLQDLQGPKLRVGSLPGGAGTHQPGDIIVLTSRPQNRPASMPPSRASR